MAEVKRETGEITLDGLADAYEIVGELRGMDDVRRFLATRRNDGAEVMIAIVHAGSGPGENTALSHFGSDVNVLRAASHPGVLQVLEGKWLGPATFAAVTERPHGRSLREMVAAGDRVANARIATMLQDVNAVLEWARAQDVVHRGIRPDGMYVEAGTGRMLVALLPMPIAAAGVPGAATDARTLGALAWALLAGRDAPADIDDSSLKDVRPDLAERVVSAVEEMRSATRDAMPNVSGFLSMIATADVLKQAEDDAALHRAEFAEQRRIQRETWEAERMAAERRVSEAESRLAADYADRLVREEPRPRSRTSRVIFSAAFAVMLAVAVAIVHYANRRPAVPAAIKIGGTTVVPTPPPIHEQ